MTFWHSDLGQISGKQEDAYAKSYKSIPDNTTATAKIMSFTNKEYNGSPYLQVDWSITSDDFNGRRIFQKLHVFDAEPKKRYRFLNLLMLMYNMYGLTPASDEAPTDNELKAFEGKEAGIKIQLTEPNHEGKQYNWVSELHPTKGFVCEIGLETIKPPPRDRGLDSAFARNKKVDMTIEAFDDSDIPF